MWYLTAALLILCSWVGSRDVFYDTSPTHLESSVCMVQIDNTKIRYGSMSLFDEKRMDKIGTLRSTEVYEAISHYKLIKKEGVVEGSARWNQLMQEATDVYKSALESIARENTYVLLVEEGGVKEYSTTDVTSLLVKKVQ